MPLERIGDLDRQEIIHLVERMLSQNEASDAQAYQLSHAEIGNSGYSFGRCQHDCAANSGAREFVAGLLEAEQVSSRDKSQIIEVLSDHHRHLSDSQLRIVNQAITRHHDMVSAYDSRTIATHVDHVHQVVSNLHNAQAKNQLLSNPKGFLSLVDYHNQFNLNPDGNMVNFLNGNLSVSGRHYQADAPLISELRHFINVGTKHGREHPADCLRRQQNIDHLDIRESRPSIVSSLAPVAVAPASTFFQAPPPPPVPQVTVQPVPINVGGAAGGGVQVTHQPSGVSGTVGGTPMNGGGFEVSVSIPIPCAIM